MDLVLLRSFTAVAAAGSFSGAADALGCVQSNVTARIRRLENHFGQSVFERGRGGARLTRFGERLLTHAEDLLSRFEAAERELLDQAGGRAPLRIGAMETTAALRLPPLLKALRDAAPEAPISLHTGPTAELLRMVWDRRLDAAFVAGPVDLNRFDSVEAFNERLAAASAVGPDRNCANTDRPVGPLIAFRQGCSYRATAEAWLKAQGRMDVETIEMGTLDGILGCVAAGLGFAVVPEAAMPGSRMADDLRCDALPDPFGLTVTHLVWRRDQTPVRALSVLLDQFG